MIARIAAALALTLAVAAPACTDGTDDTASLDSFCEAIGDLAANDPFAELAVASGEEMRDAFVRLGAGVERIADAAPEEHRARVARYRDAFAEVRDQLRGAGFDPRQLDALDYRTAVDEYESAATAVEDAAAADCP